MRVRSGIYLVILPPTLIKNQQPVLKIHQVEFHSAYYYALLLICTCVRWGGYGKLSQSLIAANPVRSNI